MIESMTGFGKIDFEDENRRILIEIRCLNSKQMDFNFKASGILKEKEAGIRTLVSKYLKRGKVDLNIYYHNLKDPAVPVINKEVVTNYFEQINNLREFENPPVFEELLPSILRLPDVMKSGKQEMEEEEWEIIRKQLVHVLENVKSFRLQEGASLEKDITKRVAIIGELLEKIIPFETNRLEKIKIRISEKMNELQNNKDFDKNRFEQELIYFLEKLDITEEKIRLKNHIDYFFNSMNTKEPIGKKLGFISQEMGREINTIGSKANDSDIQKIVVMMKDELEKVKEQLLNVM
jgi:uncharacterized protein (TIGR00255 family)